MTRRKKNSRTKKAAQKRTSRRTTKPASKPRSPRYSTLTPRQKATYERATSLLSDLRAGRGSFSELVRKYHLDRRTARKYLGRDLVGGMRGEPVRASKSDRRVRDVWFPTAFGDVTIRTRSSRNATKLADFMNDRKKLLAKKLSPAEFEAKWHSVRVAGKELFVDVAGIRDMEDAEILKMQDLYASTTSAR